MYEEYIEHRDPRNTCHFDTIDGVMQYPNMSLGVRQMHTQILRIMEKHGIKEFYPHREVDTIIQIRDFRHVRRLEDMAWCPLGMAIYRIHDDGSVTIYN